MTCGALSCQVGAFPHYGGRWSEWNGHFRDTVRQFIKARTAAPLAPECYDAVVDVANDCCPTCTCFRQPFFIRVEYSESFSGV